MGLAIKGQRGKGCPVLICDSCRRPIGDWNRAIVNFAPTLDGSVSDIRIYHKGKCDPRKGCWIPLRQYFPWLMCNHNWGIRKHTNKGDRLTMEVPEPLEI